MAQTEKSQTAIRSLLADNEAGNISPEDLRDALASAMGYAGLVLSASGGPVTMTDISTTYGVIDIFDTITAESSDVNTNGSEVVLSTDYAITVKSSGVYKVSFWASFGVTGGGETISVALYANGSPTILEVERDVATSTYGVISFDGIMALAADDIIDARIKIATGTDDVNFKSAGLSLFRVG